MGGQKQDTGCGLSMLSGEAFGREAVQGRLAPLGHPQAGGRDGVGDSWASLSLFNGKKSLFLSVEVAGSSPVSLKAVRSPCGNFSEILGMMTKYDM